MSADKIASLQIEIDSNSQSASNGLQALTATLEKLKTATKGGMGLTAVANQLSKINTAVNGMGDMSKLNEMVTALKNLGGVKISATIGNNITSIATSLNSLQINDDVGEKIGTLIEKLRPLSEMPKSNLASYVTPLKNLPDTLKALNNLDMEAFSTKIQEVAKAMKPLADEMEKVAAGFSAFPSRIQKLIASTEKLPSANNKASMSFVNLYARLKMATSAVKRIGSTIGKCIKGFNDYVENVNLFNVSMGEFADEATEYMTKVNQLTGIDMSEWARSQGVFMTLATGFGVVGDRAYTMSQQLTQLGYDISSFYNIDVADAMQKLQSGISGELEPLRRLGYDLSQAKLEAVALSLGIDKSVKSMTQAEKAELRYYAIMTQVTTAQGDLARTIDTPANQLRILKSQFEQCSRSIGSIFIPMLNKVLPYVNAFFQIVRAIADVIAKLVGFTFPEVDYSGVTSGAGEITEGFDSATESAKKLKKYTMGFDELNVIDTSGGNEDAASSFGTGFDFELPTYDFLEGLQESKVAQIVDGMKEWLGITDEIDSWSELMETRFGKILSLVGEIGAVILAWKLSKGLINGLNGIKALPKGLAKGVAITLGGVVTFAGLSIQWSGLIDAIKDGVDGLNLSEILLGGGTIIAGATLIGSAFGKALMGGAIGGIVASVPAIAVGLYDAFTEGINLANGSLITFGTTALVASILSIISGVKGMLLGAVAGFVIGLAATGATYIYQNTESITQKVGAILSGALLAVGAILAFTGVSLPLGIALMATGALSLGSAIALNSGALSDEIKNTIALITGIVSVALLEVGAILAFSGVNIPLGIALMAGGAVTMATAIVPNWNSLSDSVKETVTKIMTIVGAAALVVGAILAFTGVGIPLGIGLMLTGAASLGTAVALNWNYLTDKIGEICNKIKEIWSNVLKWFNEKLIAPLTQSFTNFWDSLKGWASDCWEGIKSVFSNVGEFFSETFTKAWAGIVDVFSIAGDIFNDIKDGVVNAFFTVVNGIIGGINKVVKVPFDAINGVLKWLRDIEIAGITPFSGIKLITVPQIPKIEMKAEGGMVDTGQMFIAREAGPELVGTIGNKTAVVNNEQIIQGIATGVSVANSESNALLREQNSLLLRLLEKETGFYLDGKDISNSVDKYKRERGRQIVAGGAY